MLRRGASQRPPTGAWRSLRRLELEFPARRRLLLFLRLFLLRFLFLFLLLGAPEASFPPGAFEPRGHTHGGAADEHVPIVPIPPELQAFEPPGQRNAPRVSKERLQPCPSAQHGAAQWQKRFSGCMVAALAWPSACSHPHVGGRFDRV